MSKFYFMYVTSGNFFESCVDGGADGTILIYVQDIHHTAVKTVETRLVTKYPSWKSVIKSTYTTPIDL